MSTIVLAAADGIVGGLAGAASSALGGLVTGAMSGARAGDAVRVTEGPRLADVHGLGSTEGAPIPRVYGRARVGGQLIWATRIEEVATTSTTVERAARSGGKGIGARPKATSTVSTTYGYYANLAVGLCEGPIAFVRRVWADGRELDLTGLTLRIHAGGEAQDPDPLIVAKEGAGAAPAYRGLAYAVFERLPLAPFGNRVPQLSFEVVRAVDGLRQMIRSVCLIPGSTEFGYDDRAVSRMLGLGASAPENAHQLQRLTDIDASIDWLRALCPNLVHVSVVASWFGDDLRADHCTIAPRVDVHGKETEGGTWSVAGLTRLEADEVSRVDDKPAYGGTPSDDGLVRLIGKLKARGLAVTLYPFVMMDVPAGNDRPDPHTGAEFQPAYPWRGRITCDPAPGRSGSPDGTPAAAAQVDAIFGAASGWGLRRLVHHYAAVAVAAGGVDGFVIGSELVGLTRVQSGPGAYPAVSALRGLAAEARAILGPATKLVYAADWTEYGADVRAGGAEVRFPLDPLWADAHIDAVGIDYYPPISDWRDGAAHADLALARSAYDVDYLRGRLGAGEAFDWYYASAEDRAAQQRTLITDGAFGKPWTFRPKDLAAWWSSPHVERVGGAEAGATAWVPGSKPIWLTEIGIPAVDKGPNGPNVFPDPKSSENATPPHSSGARDDLAQVRGLEAILTRFDPALPAHVPGSNPSAPAYGGRMVDPSRISVWCWDARPYPAFPDFEAVWSDGANWQRGHWITGRLEGAPLDRLVAELLADHGLEPTGAEALDGFVDGYIVDRPMSAREALDPLARVFGFDAVARAGAVTFRGRGGRVDAAIPLNALVEPAEDEPRFSRRRAQETDLPAAVNLGFTDEAGEYARAVAGSRKLAGGSRREVALDVAAVLRREEAQRLADSRLQDLWAGRETVEFALSPRAVEIEPGDVLLLGEAGNAPVRVIRIVDGSVRRVTAEAVEPAVFGAPPRPAARPAGRPAPPLPGPPLAIAFDLPAVLGRPEPLAEVAVAAAPWPGGMALWREAAGGGFVLDRVLDLPAVLGRTLTVLGPGPLWRWQAGASLDVELSGPAFESIGREAALAGGNLFALLGPDGAAEILAASTAELIGPRRYRLSDLLRGLAGSEEAAERSLATGARLVRLDDGVVPLATDLAALGTMRRYRVAPLGRDQADATAVTLDVTLGGAALRPLSPVRVRASRGPDGVTIRWTRRTRLDGDGWELAEVPLGEDEERYAVDIRAGAVTLRTLETGEPSVTYAAADETSDFGAPQAALSLAIAQLSRAVGRGSPRTVVVPITRQDLP